MQNYALNELCHSLEMSNTELHEIIDLVYSECGIYLNAGKKSMVTTRLSKRVRALGFSSFRDYYNFLYSPEGKAKELTSMIDVMTTNITEFFRESKHFDYLTKEVLPRLTHSERFIRQNHLTVWSAGCSTGEEPYTLAMVLSEYFRGVCSYFSILATDISTRVLCKAKKAVYPAEEMSGVPLLLRNKYMMRGLGPQKGNYRVVPELRARVVFNRLNFMDDFSLPAQLDVIFCRNVIIYFDNPTKAELLEKFYNSLVPGGYFFAGHSETLNGLNDKFISVAPTIYMRPK